MIVKTAKEIIKENVKTAKEIIKENDFNCSDCGGLVISDCHNYHFDEIKDNKRYVDVEDVRSFIKKFFVLDEGETNNLLSYFDEEINYDEEWL